MALLLALDISSLRHCGKDRAKASNLCAPSAISCKRKEKTLQADVQRGRKIRFAAAGGEGCDAFYHENFLGRTAPSSVESDHDAIAQKAGLRTSGISFKRTALKDRGVTEFP